MQHVGKNYTTFQRGKALLKRGDLLLIFPEGFSRQSKKLEPFKKGAARVALQTTFGDGGVADLNIQSIALHYSFHGIHSDLLIHVGEKTNLDRYAATYAELPAKAVNELTEEMALLFERNVIHVNDDNKTNVAEDVLVVIYNECLQKKSNFLLEARAFCKRIDAKDSMEFDLFSQQVKQYNAMLHKYNINDRALSSNPIQPVKLISNLLLTVELYLFGSIFWLIPGKVAKWIADRTVTRIDFYTSVTTGVLAFLSLFWWIACTLVAFLNGWQWLTFLFVVSPLIAYSTMQWKYDFKDVTAFYNWRRLQKMHPDTAIEIAALRTDLLT
jgi:hypothetical protein